LVELFLLSLFLISICHHELGYVEGGGVISRQKRAAATRQPLLWQLANHVHQQSAIILLHIDSPALTLSFSNLI
jgi:hypothetical protein